MFGRVPDAVRVLLGPSRVLHGARQILRRASRVWLKGCGRVLFEAWRVLLGVVGVPGASRVLLGTARFPPQGLREFCQGLCTGFAEFCCSALCEFCAGLCALCWGSGRVLLGASPVLLGAARVLRGASRAAAAALGVFCGASRVLLGAERVVRRLWANSARGCAGFARTLRVLH